MAVQATVSMLPTKTVSRHASGKPWSNLTSRKHTVTQPHSNTLSHIQPTLSAETQQRPPAAAAANTLSKTSGLVCRTMRGTNRPGAPGRSGRGSRQPRRCTWGAEGREG